MAISNELSTQFAKVINTKQKDEGQTVRGTYKEINGIKYVQLDGSDILTPVKTTVDAETGDKVSVLIKDHDATIMGNISSPAARAMVVENLSDTVDEQGNTIEQLDNTIIQQGNSIVQMNTTINQHTTTISQHDTTIRQQGDRITSIDNTVTAQGNTIDSLNNTVTQHGDTITSIGNTVTTQGNTLVQHGNRITQNENTITQQGNTISEYGDQITSIGNTVTAQGNTITSHDTSINTANANINILNSGFTIENGVLTGLSSIIVNDLTTNKLTTSYAKIDFSNIGIAAIQKLFTDSGIIRDLVVQQGHITGELVGVTIKGDLIESNTLKADKLVVKGSDGLYYKLNIDGMDHISTEQATKFILTTSEPTNWSDNYKDYYIISNNEYIHVTGNTPPQWASNTYYKLKSTYESGLDGTTIVAHTITADKISVTDLVAFGATIGGFDIDNNSIHSHTKTSINSDANGIYIGNDGQMYLGDQNNKIKYYKDNNNQWHLDISANSLKFSTHSKTIAEELDDLEQSIEVLRADLDNNIIVVSVDNTGKPFDNKNYEIDYNVLYLGSPLLTGYTITTNDVHTGITTDLTTLGKIKFSVSTNTAIITEDNKYTFTISYTNSGNTFTSIRTVMISTLSSDVEQNVIISETEPSDKDVLWYDSSNNTLKKYNPIVHTYELTSDTVFGENKNYYEEIDDEYELIDYNSTTHKYTLYDGTEYSVGDTIPSDTIYIQNTAGGDWSEVNSTDADITRIEGLITGENGLQSKYDNLEKRIGDAENDLSSKVDSSTFNNYKSEVQTIQGNYYTKTEINQIASGVGVDGVTVTAVKSIQATFDMNGMHYQKSTNDTISTINEEGLTVDDKYSNELFFAGVREGESTSIVQTSNLKSDTYVIFGNAKGRLQEFTDPDVNISGVGLFLL